MAAPEASRAKSLGRDRVTSIVIVSFNARDHLRRCLESLFLHQHGDFEVVVVDNASPDGSAALVEAEFREVNLLRNTSNLGFAVAANAGARAATGDVVAFVNPDCTIEDDAFSAPADFLRANPEVGAVGPRILDPDGGLQLSVRRFPGPSVWLFNRYSLLTRWFPGNRFSRRYLMTDWDHSALAGVDWVSGACVLTTRDVLARVGHFDERYFWGFEDVDFCQRVHRAGLSVVYFPDSVVRHEIGASARTVPSRALIARHRGMWLYYRTYLSVGIAADAVVFAAIWARCGLQLMAGYARRALGR